MEPPPLRFGDLRPTRPAGCSHLCDTSLALPGGSFRGPWASAPVGATPHSIEESRIMIRSALPFSLAVALLLSSCIRFSPGDLCPRGPVVDNWIGATTDRITRVNTDTTIASLGLQQLYLDQVAQQTPPCLSTAQEHAVESFLQQWQAAQRPRDSRSSLVGRAARPVKASIA